MTAITASNPPAVVQERADVRTDLARDIAALLGRNGVIDPFAVQSRPAILRRVARMLAEQIPAGTDRLIAEQADAPLAAAVALHTGIAFALVDAGTGDLSGELHRSETVAILQTRSPRHPAALPDRVGSEGARLERVLTVIDTDSAETASRANESAEQTQSWQTWSLFRLGELS